MNKLNRWPIARKLVLYAKELSVHPPKPVKQLEITVKRQDGETVLEGEAWCCTFR